MHKKITRILLGDQIFIQLSVFWKESIYFARPRVWYKRSLSRCFSSKVSNCFSLALWPKRVLPKNFSICSTVSIVFERTSSTETPNSSAWRITSGLGRKLPVKTRQVVEVYASVTKRRNTWVMQFLPTAQEWNTFSVSTDFYCAIYPIKHLLSIR